MRRERLTSGLAAPRAGELQEKPMADRLYFFPTSVIQSPRGLSWFVRRLGIGAIAVGAIQIAVCAVILVRTAAWTSATATVEGSVVAHQSPASRPGARRPAGGVRPATVAEVVRYVDAAGVERRFTSSISTSHPFALGASVPVRYRPDAPDDATIDTFFRTWGLPVIFAGAGALMAGVGVIFLRAGRSFG